MIRKAPGINSYDPGQLDALMTSVESIENNIININSRIDTIEETVSHALNVFNRSSVTIDGILPEVVLDSQLQIASQAEILNQDIEALKKELLDFDVEKLKKYAEENNIDIGNATSQNGIYKKITEHLEAQRKD